MTDTIFCPYCGAKTVDQGPTRTRCTTCGEDVVTPGQLEDLRDNYANLEKALEKTEAERDQALKDLEKAEKDLEDADDLIADCKAALHLVLTGPVNLPARIVEACIDIHKRLP